MVSDLGTCKAFSCKADSAMVRPAQVRCEVW